MRNANSSKGPTRGAGLPQEFSQWKPPLWVSTSQQHLMRTLVVYDFKEVVNMLVP